MFGFSQFGPARMFGSKDAVKLALVKAGVSVVLRVGALVQGRSRRRPLPRRTSLTAAV